VGLVDKYCHYHTCSQNTGLIRINTNQTEGLKKAISCFIAIKQDLVLVKNADKLSYILG